MTAVLVKQEVHKDGPEMQDAYRMLSSTRDRLNQSLMRSQLQSGNSDTQNQLNSPEYQGKFYEKCIMETQLEISSYRLIDKILLFLSKLPAQMSFYQLYPMFKDLSRFKYFNNYLDIWLQQTSQTVNTQVLFTSMKQGSHQVINESSYLDKDFFEQYPVQNYARECQGILPNYATYKKFRDFQMQQVSIKMIQVSWLKDYRMSKAFFEGLIESENLLLFKNHNMIVLIRYLWNIC